MSREDTLKTGGGTYELQDVFDQLDELEEAVTGSKELQAVRRTRRMLERVPGSDRIKKYTS